MERLQRILASRGVASRRAAENLIREGRVKVNGQVVTELGTRADARRDEIRVDNEILRAQPLRYVILNKPTGYITTVSDERGRWTVMDLINVSERVYPVGRLDRDTEGLLLFSNDGDVANRVMHPRYRLAKEYHVLTRTRPAPQQLERIRKGIVIDGRRIVPEEVRLLRESADGIIITITVHEGIHHLVRRIMEVAGIEVERLRRARIGPLSITGLRIGEWRDLTPGEQSTLFEALHLEEDAASRGEGRPIRIRASAPQPPANPLWKRPKREGEEAEPAAPRPPRSPSRRDRDAPRERGAPDKQRRSGSESDDRPKRERNQRRSERPDQSERDRDRRARGKREDDRRRPPGRAPRRRVS